MNKFNENFKKERLKRKLSQRFLAEVFGVSQNTVFNWENNFEPDTETLKKIAEYFNMDINELIGYTPDNIPPRSYVEQRIKSLIDKYDLSTLSEEQLDEFLTVAEITAKNIKKRG